MLTPDGRRPTEKEKRKAIHAFWLDPAVRALVFGENITDRERKESDMTTHEAEAQAKARKRAGLTARPTPPRKRNEVLVAGQHPGRPIRELAEEERQRHRRGPDMPSKPTTAQARPPATASALELFVADLTPEGRESLAEILTAARVRDLRAKKRQLTSELQALDRELTQRQRMAQKHALAGGEGE